MKGEENKKGGRRDKRREEKRVGERGRETGKRERGGHGEEKRQGEKEMVRLAGSERKGAFRLVRHESMWKD